MALELVALVAVSLSALILAWMYLKAQQELAYQRQQARRLRLEIQEQPQLESPQPQSVYLTQLQLKNQELTAQVRQSQSENQELKAQLAYQQRLGFPQGQVAGSFVSPQVQGQQLLAQCHCSNQGSCQSGCC
jgi:hypothetical protein